MRAAPLAGLLVALLSSACTASATPDRPGVILVSVDTLRADRVFPWGGDPSESPTFRRLAQESIVFEHAYSTANETLFSHASIFTSKVASHIGNLDYDLTIPDGMPTLAGTLSAAGYRTGAVVAGGHLGRIFGLDDGFEEYAEGRWWGSFQETVPMALRWLDQPEGEGKLPFAFVHGYDCHIPYLKPVVFGRMVAPGYDGRFLELSHDPHFYEKVYRGRFYPDFELEVVENQAGSTLLDPGTYARLAEYAADPTHEFLELSARDLEWLRGSYQSAAFYADLWLEVLLTELDERGLLDTSVLVVTSDHGEELLDHGYFNHRSTLRDATTRVPLLVRLPGGRGGGRRVSAPVSTLDIAPTLLALSGVARPDGMEGTDLSPCLEGDCAGSIAYSEGVLDMVSVTDGRWRLLVDGAPAADPAMDALVAAGDTASTHLYDSSEPDGPDRATDPALADVVARLRAAIQQARARR
jgi:arylsulfatase A-like enzyme